MLQQQQQQQQQQPQQQPQQQVPTSYAHLPRPSQPQPMHRSAVPQSVRASPPPGDGTLGAPVTDAEIRKLTSFQMQCISAPFATPSASRSTQPTPQSQQ
eukprot:TRINITY_DN18206_c0_g1_i1.p2 TRINITY_DN18206_c0_g1~~TRINITY_DN18206_c0_g1_i1.p2  ORF type:complete len:115 (+),score=5.72 TRINITY_DN18206_c0_g1_i1:51-347(+)